MSDELNIAAGEGVVTTEKLNDYVVTPEISTSLARRATDLIAAGMKPKEAARAAGVPEPMLKNPALLAVLEMCKGTAILNEDISRQLLRSANMNTWLALTAKGHQQLEETGETDILMAAHKYAEMLRRDPAIGLNASPLVQVNLDMKPVQGLIEEAAKTAPKDVFNWEIEEVTGEEETTDNG